MHYEDHSVPLYFLFVYVEQKNFESRHFLYLRFQDREQENNKMDINAIILIRQILKVFILEKKNLRG